MKNKFYILALKSQFVMALLFGFTQLQASVTHNNSGTPLEINIAARQTGKNIQGKTYFSLLLKVNPDLFNISDLKISLKGGISELEFSQAQTLDPSLVMIQVFTGNQRPENGTIGFIKYPVDGVLLHVTVADICGTDSDDNIANAPKPNENDTHNNGGGFGDYLTQPFANPQTSGNNHHPVQISVYPNPTTESVNIVTEGEVMWGMAQVTDVTGKLMKTSKIGDSADQYAHQIQINLSDLKPGIYFIKFRTDKDTYIKRVLLE